MKIGTKRIKRDRLIVECDGLVDMTQGPCQVGLIAQDVGAARCEFGCLSEGRGSPVPIEVVIGLDHA
jgi:hypothetical protein